MGSNPITRFESVRARSQVQAWDLLLFSGDSAAADALETMLDGTGGNVLSLGRLVISANNASGAVDIDNSFGPGVDIEGGGGAFYGVDIQGGEPNGTGLGLFGGYNGVGSHGMYIEGSGPNGSALVLSGSGSGDGIQALGGGTGDGIHAIRGGASAYDINAINSNLPTAAVESVSTTVTLLHEEILELQGVGFDTATHSNTALADLLGWIRRMLMGR